MADKWMDERDRDERDWRRADYEGRWPERGSAQYRGEGRSFRDDDEHSRGDYQGDGGYEGGRDRVFGEQESGAAYNRPQQRYRPMPGGWQNPEYGGVSPAMRKGEYSLQRPRFQNQDYTRGGQAGGRYYGDDERERIYREEYGQGGVEHGDVPRGYDAGYSPTRARYHRQGYGEPGYGGEFRRPASGGTGGYDYERGYGDAGRSEAGRSEGGREDRGYEDRDRGQRFEDAGRGAGDFLHRAGEKVASWFGGGEGRADEPDDRNASGMRGKGPAGYKRPDERINEEAHERLTDDAWLDASNITISVSGGEVTLSGTVETREAKHRAERLVEHISGVNHVQNNLRMAKGSFLTSPGSGYGDSVAEAQMRKDEPASNGTGGAGGGQSTAGRKN